MVVKVTAILPKKLDIKAMLKTIEKEFFNGVDDIQDDFEKTVKTWKDNDIFERKDKVSSRELSGEVSTDNDRYRYLNDGTKAHFVRPVKAKALVFSENYKKKNKPRFIGSRSGGPSGKKVFSRGHRVKGIEKHEFEETIKNKQEPLLVKRMNKAMDESAKVSDNPI